MHRAFAALAVVPLVALGFLAIGPVAAAADQGLPEPVIDSDESELFALNLYHEARSEGPDGMIAVGWVVLNRAADPEYPDSVEGVITDGADSRCKWGLLCDGKSDQPKEADMWALARDVTELMASPDRPADPTRGALWFHRTVREKPSWMADQVQRTATLGSHHFYGRN